MPRTSGYQVLEILGTGAYGTVCVAQPIGTERKVVLKVLHPELLTHPDVLARTRDEARLLTRLSHPNIVRVEALEQHQGRPVVVMEHVDGVDLGTVLHHHRAGLPAAIVLASIRSVASALDVAWRSLKVVHRDVKPSNLLLSTDGTIKLVDFGLAHAEFEGRETQTLALVLGSLGFMAPEQNSGGPPLPSVDIYALGITTVRLLADRTLLLPRSLERHDPELVRQLGLLEVEGLSADALGALRRLLAQMCALSPAQRPSAAEVVEALEALAPAVDARTLADFGARSVALARRDRSVQPPRSHPDWPHVSFLDPDEPRLLPHRRGNAGPLAALVRILSQLSLRPRRRALD